MKDTKQSAELVLTKTSLKIKGDGKINEIFNRELVQRLFKLPPHRSLVWMGQEVELTASDILTRLTKTSYESFRSVLKWNKDLADEHAFKVSNFAAYAHPTSGVWPDDDGLMVLETIPVDLPYLLYISWRLDGTIGLCMLQDNQTLTMTPEEFRFAWGKTFQEYCEAHLPLTIEKCQRALALIAIQALKKAVVSYINKDSAVEKKTMIYWQADQIDQYLHRNALSHIITEPEE
ncbi:MAG: hypothetical protein WC869_00225 [Phycisphaerae bacterium]|jgi:hypothetical protein